MTPSDPAATTFDPIWQQKYLTGLRSRYPWDIVVSFVFRNAPAGVPAEEVRILEVGCGTGSNLWFAAREGFRVTGVDASAAAIAAAEERFAAEGLEGEFVVADFSEPLTSPPDHFDLAIDRGSITCTGFSSGRKCLREIRRCLKPGGRLLFNPYSRAHTSYAAGVPAADGLVRDIRRGTMVGVGQLCFYSEDMVREVLSDGWVIESLSHTETRTLPGPSEEPDVHAEWRVVARRADGPA